jgi:hypothetical protein
MLLVLNRRMMGWMKCPSGWMTGWMDGFRGSARSTPLAYMVFMCLHFK